MIHIFTGEFPPVSGGVSDYTALVARSLAAQGEAVHVWTSGSVITPTEPGVTVHRTQAEFTPEGLRQFDSELNHYPSPRRILVQWTPHSFGFRSLNPFLPLWLWKRAFFQKDHVEVMAHEPFLAFGEGTWRQDLAAIVHRVNIVVLLAAASKIWLSIPAWESALRPWCLRRSTEFAWLPVPSNVATDRDHSVPRLRGSCPVVGHFGSYRPDIARLLMPALRQILPQSDAAILLAGSGSLEFHSRFLTENPRFESRLIIAGELSSSGVTRVLSACDIMLQPYPDGISTRRGTAMTALALGLPVVSNLGRLSEPFWAAARPIALAASSHPDDLAFSTLELLGNSERRSELARRARSVYQARFDIRHTISALLPATAQAGKSSRVAA